MGDLVENPITNFFDYVSAGFADVIDSIPVIGTAITGDHPIDANGYPVDGGSTPAGAQVGSTDVPQVGAGNSVTSEIASGNLGAVVPDLLSGLAPGATNWKPWIIGAAFLLFLALLVALLHEAKGV